MQNWKIYGKPWIKEDPRTGICLTYQNWAEYFTGEFAHTIYNELIKSKQVNERK